MKTLSRDEMKKVLGGFESEKICGQCCIGTDCTVSMCNPTCKAGATFVAEGDCCANFF